MVAKTSESSGAEAKAATATKAKEPAQRTNAAGVPKAPPADLPSTLPKAEEKYPTEYFEAVGINTGIDGDKIKTDSSGKIINSPEG